MPIAAPGVRDRHGKKKVMARSAVMPLMLTSMVDMFTILVIFLLQNYSSTGEILYIPKDVHLPKAQEIKELKPAHVVTITMNEIVLDKDSVAKLDDVKAAKDWMIPNLQVRLTEALQKDEIDAKQALAGNIRKSLNAGPRPGSTPVPEESRRKVTVQADKDMDFLTIKKVMFTVTEAGATEINFAVMKKEGQPPVTQ
jgi:biopolymer transport protein ExbD